MSDYNIFIKKQSMVFLGGPPLVKMATGEDSDAESLGGADMHCRVSGLGDYLAEDELDGIRICREVMAHLNWRKEGPGPTLPARRAALRFRRSFWAWSRGICARRSTSAT